MARTGTIRIDWPMVAGAAAFIVVGGGFSAMGLWHIWMTASFLSDAVPVTGVVVDTALMAGETADTNRPVFAFNWPNGETARAPSLLASSSYGFQVGSEVPILINPGQPNHVRVAGAANLWLFGAGFAALGGIFPPMGIWILFRFGLTRFPGRPR